jgi:hypothetical protein
LETKANPVDPRKNIRWVAVGLTPWMWFIGIAFAVHYGESIPRAMAISAVPCISVLAVWAFNYLISRQNNGILFLIFALAVAFPVGQASYHPDVLLYYDVIPRVANNIALVLIFCIISILLRAFPRSKRGSGKSKKGQTISPLWDKEVDLPSTK